MIQNFQIYHPCFRKQQSIINCGLCFNQCLPGSQVDVFHKISRSLPLVFITLIHHPFLFGFLENSWKFDSRPLRKLLPHLQEFLATPATFQRQKPGEGAITMCHQSWETHLGKRPPQPDPWNPSFWRSGACRLAENQKGGRSFFMTSMAARLPKVLPPTLQKMATGTTMDVTAISFQAKVW